MIQQFFADNYTYFLSFSVSLVLTFILVALFRRFFNRFLNSIEDKPTVDKTNYHFLRYLVIAVIYSVGFAVAIYSVPSFRALGNTVLAGAGVIALAVSFASQQALSNVVSGMFVVMFKPFKINDRIELVSQNLAGVIEDITLRHTVIRDYENRRIIVPNSIISQEVIVNADYSDANICKHLTFGISYDSNIEKAREIIQQLAENHPLSIDNRSEEDKEKGSPIVVVRVVDLADSSINLKAFIWVKDQTDSFVLRSELLESIKLKFDEEGIKIPYPHRSIIMNQSASESNLS